VKSVGEARRTVFKSYLQSYGFHWWEKDESIWRK